MASLRKVIGERIRKLRQELGLTLKKAADRVDMDPIYWGRVERGEKNITLGTIERMIQALKVDPLEVLTASGPKDTGDLELLRSQLGRLSPDSRKQIIALAKHLAASRK